MNIPAGLGSSGFRLSHLAVVCVLLMSFAVRGLAAELTGTVVRPGGAGVPGVDIDVIDVATGDSIPLSNDVTDAAGHFTVTVPDGATYDVRFGAPVATRLVSRIVEGVVVTTGVIDMGILPLEAGALLTGIVVRLADGTPVAGVDTDVDRSSTGERVYTPGDNTDSGGLFEVIVPLEPVDLSVEPNKAERLVGLLLRDLPISGDTSVGVLPLEPGALLTGTVVRASNGTPVVGADTDLEDAATGAAIPTAGDDTNEAGVFAVVAPLRPVNLTIEPVKTDRLVAVEIEGIGVAGDTNLGTIQLSGGALLSGTVVRSAGGTPVVGADTDVEDAFTGGSVPLVGDDTDANGLFSVVVPFGTVSLAVEPLKGDRLVAFRKIDVDIAGDTNLGTISLAGGFLVSGTVQGPGGPAAGVSVAAYDPSTGARIHTPDSQSDVDGSYSFVLPPGTFLVKWSPPLGQGAARFITPALQVSGDTAFDPMLAASPASVSIGETGHLVVAGQNFVPTAAGYNNSGAPLDVRGILQGELPVRGVVSPLGPSRDRTLPGAARVIAKELKVKIPANLKPQLRGLPIWIRVQLLDPVSQVLIDEDFVEFRVR